MHTPNTLLRSPDSVGSAGMYLPGEAPVMSSIDLNEQLVHNRPETFYLRVNTNCMAGAGIHSGDMLIVDRSLAPGNGKVVIAQLDGDLLVRYYEQQLGRIRLVPATPTLSPVEVDRSSQFMVWGVVTYVIRKV